MADRKETCWSPSTGSTPSLVAAPMMSSLALCRETVYVALHIPATRAYSLIVNGLQSLPRGLLSGRAGESVAVALPCSDYSDNLDTVILICRLEQMAATCPHTGLVVCDSCRSLLRIRELRDPITGSLRCFDAVFILLLPYIGV